MERLDACYFCGTAADAPLREVSIAPRERQGDPDATVRVTLCPSCEEKLQRVLGGLFDHVESRSAEGGAATDRRSGRDDGGRTDATTTTADDATTTDGAASAGDDPSADVASARSPGRGRVDRIDVSTGDEPRGRRRLFADPTPLKDVAGSSAGDGDEHGTGDGDEDGNGDEDGTGDGDDDRNRAEEDAEILEDEAEGSRVRARATASTGDGLDGVSVDEYNRVMRLLQNREFPMARSAFVDLATSAYDLGEDAVQAVLDVVIDQGALSERDGQLLSGDEEEAGQP